MKKSDVDGFTLVEVAIVVVIGGILLVSATSLLQIYLQKTEQRVTQSRINEVDDAIQRFLNTNNRYPCPAAIGDAPDTATFGVEGGNCATGATTFVVGAVPTRTLNLPDNVMTDAWGNKLTYVMTRVLATDGGYAVDGGDLNIVDSNGNPIIPFAATDPGAHYIVLSHGSNQFGATNILGIPRGDCTLGGANEIENCDGDDVFVSTLLLNDSFGPNSYDDYIRYREIPTNNAFVPFGALMFFDTVAYPIDCPVGWVTPPPSASVTTPASSLRACIKR